LRRALLLCRKASPDSVGIRVAERLRRLQYETIRSPISNAAQIGKRDSHIFLQHPLRSYPSRAARSAISSRSGLHSSAASGLTSISARLLPDVDREAGRRLERGANVDVLSLLCVGSGVTESVGDRAWGRARVVRCSRSQPPRRGVQSATLEAPRLSLAGNRAKINDSIACVLNRRRPPSPTPANFEDLYQIDPDLSISKYELHNYRKWRNAPGACPAPQLGYRTPPLG